MNFFKNIILISTFFIISVTAFSQRDSIPKLHAVFFEFIQKKLPLNAQESSQIRPLLIRYFNETRKLHKDFDDPLIREQQKIALKIRYRNLFIPIIGTDRSNQFFIEEQVFRKRVRDELKQRRKL